MTMTDWKASWVKTLVDDGFSPSTAVDTYNAMYGRDGPDTTKCPRKEAFALLGKLESQALDPT
jgi:hypothetical protein